MQRYRVNFPLLIGIVVGALVLTVGGYALWSYQRDHNAGRLLSRAEEAREEGDLIESARLLGQYLAIRRDDPAALATLANTYADIIDMPDVEPKQIRAALGQLESTVREQPDNATLRRRLVDLLVRFNLLKPALDHVSQLLNQTPGDEELELLRSQCLFSAADPQALDHAYRLIGYDKAAGTFDVEKGVAPHDPLVYVRIAGLLRGEMNERDLADEMIEQMVAANPESGEVLLHRGRHFASKDEERSKADILEALKIEPDNPNIVTANAMLLAADEEYDAARKLLNDCIEKNPDSATLYQTLANLAAKQQNYDEAIAQYDAGIVAVPSEKSQGLYFARARLLIERNQLDDAKLAIRTMREAGQVITPLLDYLDARLLMANAKWFKAANEFERLQSFVGRISDLSAESNFLLGFCYEKLGQSEKALGSFDLSLQADSSNRAAAAGRLRMLNKLGHAVRANQDSQIHVSLAEELAKPESDQDWESFATLVEQYSTSRDLSEAMKSILEAEILMRRKLYPEAREKLIESYKLDKENLGVRRAAVKLFASDPGQSPVKALKLLDQVVGDFGDMPILRLERGDLLIAINDEDVTDQLLDLTKNLDAWSREQKVHFWTGMAARFQRLRDTESQQFCLKQVADLSPSDMPTLINLMLMANERNDEAGVQDAQDRILRVVGSKDDPTWQFSEAYRLMMLYRSQDPDPAILDKASDLVALAMDNRPEWHQLYQLQASIDLLRNDANGALKNYDRASKLGRLTALALYQHTKLLIRDGRFADAVLEMEKSNPEVRRRLLGREYAESLHRTNRTAEALGVADELIAAAPNNGDTQFWYGKFMQTAALSPKASSQQRDALLKKSGEALEKSATLKSNSPEVWLALVSHYVAIQNPVKAEETTRLAQLALVEDQSQLLFARCYEMIGRWMDAEELYKQAAEDASTVEARARSTRLLARFYLAGVYPREDQILRATPLVNQLLRQVADGEIPGNDENARWARSTAAKLLSASGEYQKLLDAERLLSSNAENGVLRNEDQLLMAEILAPRPEPVSRLKAARLFEEIGKTQPLSYKSELNLGKLYFALDEWRKCREQMTRVIASYPKDLDARTTYLNMLIKRGGPTELDTAVRQLKRLRKLAPNSVVTREMTALVAFKRGKKREAIASLKALLPHNLKEVTPGQLTLVVRVGKMLIEFEDYKSADSLLRAAADSGGEGESILYATFVGSRVDQQKGFDLLASLAGKANPIQIVRAGINILRVHESSGKLSETNSDLVQKWLDRGLRDDPEESSLLMMQAELLELQRKNPEAVEVYRNLLEGSQLTGMRRAIVLNNLAYLLVLSSPDPSSIDEAVRYINETVSLLGPQTDVLDTRAVISIAAGRYDDAINDMKLAVIDEPTPVKYFHKAVAHLMAGQNDLAAEAWAEAVDRGLSREKVSRLEQTRYDEVKAKLEDLGLASASFWCPSALSTREPSCPASLFASLSG